ncbi:Farnesyl pyrophosphate synthase [Seminavis robusta]|uniref:Farnesyl pyrophosphate synthase n=1 Tax=Seminavis robusta TaxID=568900 RepID=A0A9N8HWK2_9STRA|nr:Farnesyl pyrophosphate synthase [Seminavis robusta]|eukprot:Sro2235_g320180.1 Farnesyl pyrophosphate synthase (413) ;mRNA; r:6893-8131
MSANGMSNASVSVIAAGAFAVGGLFTAAFMRKKQPPSFPATQGTKNATPAIAYPKYNYTGDPKGSFMAVCDMLIDEICAELPVKYDLPAKETQWVKDMLEYNVKGGKMNRGLMVVDAGVAILASQGKTPTNEELSQLAVLGWAIEWLQAWLLVADDIMDSSVTRRGQPCWYKKLEQIWYIAINDAFTIEAFVYKMMKRHFMTHPQYIQLMDLMLESTLQTEMGQLSDTLCDVLGLKDLTPERWELIVTYKTSFYSFYLSVAFAMTFCNIKDKAAFDAAREILVTMGVYFQAQDDYLDCFGTPEQIGKIGTDIADKKCGWLFTKAYHQLANDDQKAFLDKHYGNCKVGSDEEKAIKKLYADLGLPQLYAEYEQASYDKIMSMKGSKEGAVLAKAGVPWEVFEMFLQKVYKRSK